ncbi:MAG: hypothetical protein IKS55_09670 [Oscillospiraceae bacterium]|nr:hypothetical protein [Oscillospiraceae bacterium]
MISEWIEKASAGEAVWMSDLRAAFSEDPGAVLLPVRLHPVRGGLLDLPCYLPRWQNPEERRFVEEYFFAFVYNLLSVCSGQSLSFFADPGDRQTAELLETFSRAFGIGAENRQRRGYGKVINIAERLCAAEGLPPFSVSVLPVETYVPAGRPARDPSADLPERLQRCCRDAGDRILCGVDIGGTDIKLALSVKGRLVCLGEYDWNPAACTSAEEILNPVYEQIDLLRRSAEKLCSPGEPLLFNAIGISFPDIVIEDRILGGETPKTDGLRRRFGADYDREFAKIGRLDERLRPLCRPGAEIRILNDGNMAAFTAAMELAADAEPPSLRNGLIAHSLGTDLGTGWLLPDGSVPPLPLECYDLILDLGSRPAMALPPEDLRAVRNRNSGLPGARRYLGQAAAFRLAQELDPEMLAGFTAEEDGCLTVRTEPEDLRKPCLEHLMQLADRGRPEAREIFRRIGFHLGMLSREMDFLLRPETDERYLYGRFVKSETCFRLIRDGCREGMRELKLVAADENLAHSPLMKALSARRDGTVAQFGQAVGALYWAVFR